MNENFDDIFLRPNDVVTPALPEDQFAIPAGYVRPLEMSAQEFLQKLQGNTKSTLYARKHYPNNIWSA